MHGKPEGKKANLLALPCAYTESLRIRNQNQNQKIFIVKAGRAAAKDSIRYRTEQASMTEEVTLVRHEKVELGLKWVVSGLQGR